MQNLAMQLGETAGSLLRNGTVHLIVGYEEGSLPLRTSPCFIRKPEEAGRLVWNASCENNLATYLRDLPRGRDNGKIGVVAKGCDGRAIVAAIVERQLDREDLFIIAVPCQGVIDRHKVESQIGDREVLKAAFEDEALVVSGEGLCARIPLAEVLCDSCLGCEHPTAPVHDILVGDPVAPIAASDGFLEVKAVEALDPEERWALFSREYNKCLRCYACREACPLCYCSECFMDQTQPAWFGKTDDLSDTVIYHVVRALHLAGRCVDCGACSRACPMGIDLRGLNRKIMKDVEEWYGFQAGMSLDAVPPLSTFRSDDPQEFIR